MGFENALFYGVKMKVFKKELLHKEGVKGSFMFFLLGLGIFIYALVNHYSLNTEWKLSPYLFPVLTAIFIMVLAVSLFRESVLLNKTEDKGHTEWKTIIKYILACLVYYFVMPHLGFLISNIIFLAVLFIFLGERCWWKIALLSIITTVIVYVVFHVFLHVMLP